VDVANKTEPYQPMGHGLVFHPDLLLGTTLGKSIKSYNFFSYQTNEALHLSDKERLLVLDLLSKIKSELELGVDKHSKKLIATSIELFLSYCERFYDRQFITREDVNIGILEKFETLLNDYLQSDRTQIIGLPSVAYCAEKLNLSSNYFGDLIKKQTSKSAQEYIQNKVIEVSKERVIDKNKSISKVAYELGFKYPQHFSRMFKNATGYTPIEYRNQN
jgi:AraC-like DNA-binding protein